MWPSLTLWENFLIQMIDVFVLKAIIFQEVLSELREVYYFIGKCNCEA